MVDNSAEYPEYSPQSNPPPLRRPWPRTGIMILDLFIALSAWIALSIIIPLIFIFVRVAQEGTSVVESLQDPAQLLRLIGVEGIFAILLVQNIIFVGVPLMRVRLIRRESLTTLGFHSEGLLRLILIGIGMGILVLFGNISIGYTFSQFGVEQNQAAQFPLFQGDYLGQFLFFTGAAILAPIGEEVLFRGYVFKTLQHVTQHTSWGIFVAYGVSTLIFTIVHAASATEGILALLVPIFLMGLILAWGVHYTKSILPSIIAHGINNGIALMALLTCVNNPGIEGCPPM
ncbi:MAG: CPBP family intramembrane metalloprotease [Chloroflexi bacterium AL-W]|nr:CPBP family intramembrane metalloprotease [Chloroflexi bacterium AL-N1]NOK67617.1 CPBP family intramembrane metalloprotease [Chloroflexi bacterium AL-N10]NOK75613.1 CPBP family intramembrane metalloprotease [Chloroflexi bacterium AL-N5]NOK82401.1 CPBP family intramembrane metalloprotease [Chloroflexi bacterium AL-W]NOK90246.1 CPBP family intramembrane metalloprotease [Chloroflexi bacterium AL-N15]